MVNCNAFFSGRKKLFLIALLPVFASTFCLVSKYTPMPVYADNIPTEINESSYQEPPAPSSAETIMKAISKAYPDRVSPAEYRDDDWAFSIGGRWFYYAEGRILPQEIRGRAAEYRPLWFYSNYLAELPSWESTAAERASMTERMEERRASSSRQPQPARQAARRPQYFHEALWNAANREQAWAQQEQVTFLGHSLSVHSGISRQIRLINQIIVKEAETNPAVRQWIASLGTVAGWNWRNVAGSGNRSLHSYGIAIDLLPRNLGGLATYWLWTSEHDPHWWNIPFDRRYHPPPEVIRAFESFGFVWAGKWIYHFDTMHFEYRPEILILSGIEL